MRQRREIPIHIFELAYATEPTYYACVFGESLWRSQRGGSSKDITQKRYGVETCREGPRTDTNGQAALAMKKHFADNFDEKMVKIAQAVQKI